MSGSPYSQAAFKRSLLHFLSGKALSALLTFINLLWLVRLLPIPEYAAYVTLVAILEVTLALAALGLPWVAARYLPDFHLHAPRARFILLVKRLLVWHGAILIAIASVLYLLGDASLPFLGLAAYPHATMLYLAMVLLDGLGRVLRDNLLTALLQQKWTQISLAMRNGSFLVFLAINAMQGEVHIEDVVIAELAAAAIGLTLAALGLSQHLKSAAATKGDPTWREPGVLEMLNLAKQMYVGQLINLTYHPQVFLLILSSRLNVEAVATFGFLRSLYMQVCRYLPATLLFNLIRPKIVADFARAGETRNLSAQVNLVGKLSLFVLMPLVVIVAVAGDTLLASLSGGKFPQAGLYFLGLLIGLIPYSQRQLLETAAVTTGNSRLCLWASSSGLLMLPMVMILLAAGMELWAPVITMLTGNFLFNLVILLGLKRRIQYAADHNGWIRILATTLLTYLGTTALAPNTPSFGTLLVAACLTSFIYLTASRWTNPFSAHERARINTFLGKRLFRW